VPKAATETLVGSARLYSGVIQLRNGSQLAI